MFWSMVQVDPIKIYLNLKIGLPPVLKAGSSGKSSIIIKITLNRLTLIFGFRYWKTPLFVSAFNLKIFFWGEGVLKKFRK
jgi:hypothetical protein